jgi:hypothetical protein
MIFELLKYAIADGFLDELIRVAWGVPVRPGLQVRTETTYVPGNASFLA